MEDRTFPSVGFSQINLASDVPGLARVTDPHLVNPWGMAFSPTGPFWFADNGSGASDILDGRGQPFSLVVAVGSPIAAKPTGIAFNAGPGFVISKGDISAPSRFLFAGEDGVITGWTAVVDSTHTVVAVDNSSRGAVYTGLALATDPIGDSLLYAADVHHGRIDVFDQAFKPLPVPGGFVDQGLPDGFVPFNIHVIDNLLYVTYARQGDDGGDVPAGEGFGFIDIYNLNGSLVRRFASSGPLNAPWGLARAPDGFGGFSGALLVGNNGDGRVNAFDLSSGEFLGALSDEHGAPLAIPDLWALSFGNGHLAGDAWTLFFTAGIDEEVHGLFGAIQASERQGADTAGIGVFDPHAPGEPGDYPLPPRDGPTTRGTADNRQFTNAVLLSTNGSSLILIPTLTAASEQRSNNDPSSAISIAPVSVPSRLLDFAVAAAPADDVWTFSASDDGNSMLLSDFLDVNTGQYPLHPTAVQRSDPGFGARRQSSVVGAFVSFEAPTRGELEDTDVAKPVRDWQPATGLDSGRSSSASSSRLTAKGDADTQLEAKGAWDLSDEFMFGVGLAAICWLSKAGSNRCLSGNRWRFGELTRDVDNG